MAPLLITSSAPEDKRAPIRIYSDATGEGGLALGDAKLRDMAARSDKIYICELLASIATVSHLRGDFWGRNVILSVDNAAAFAALTKGAAKSKVVLSLVYTLWRIAAQYDVPIWPGRVATKVNPADLPPGDGKLSFPTEIKTDLVSLFGRISMCDLS